MRHHATGPRRARLSAPLSQEIRLPRRYVEHFPPDTAAAYIWLKNRQPHRWRDKKEVSATADVNETKTLRLKLSPRALAHVEELKRLLLRDDDEPLELAPLAPANGATNGVGNGAL